MGGIIVALPKAEDAKNICEILRKRGIEVSAVCNTGNGILQQVNRFDYSIVICSKRFPDMHYMEIYGYLPKNSKMILLTSPNATVINRPEIRTLLLPFRPIDLVNMVNELLCIMRKNIKLRQVPKKRSDDEKRIIDNAKYLLMQKKNMTEQEAFRYIQKCSMDSGTNMVEMAQMIISVNYGSVLLDGVQQ